MPNGSWSCERNLCMHVLVHRYLLNDWAEQEGTKSKWAWETKKVHPLSRLAALETLKSSGVVGWGCCRLVNVSTKKPAESAALAMPPAVAVLRRRPEGDQQLTISFHVAMLHQVKRLN